MVAGLALGLVVLGESANLKLEKLHISYPMAQILFSVYFSDCFGFILLEFNSLDSRLSICTNSLPIPFDILDTPDDDNRSPLGFIILLPGLD